MVLKFLNKKEKIHKNIIDSCYNEVSVKSIIAFVLAQKRQERGGFLQNKLRDLPEPAELT